MNSVCDFGQFVNSLSLRFLLYEMEVKNMYITGSLKGLKVTVTQSLCHYRTRCVNGQLSLPLAEALVDKDEKYSRNSETAGAQAPPHKHHETGC